MKIQIIRRQCGGTEFYPVPHRLHLGAQNAAGVDELHFSLPEEWSGCTVALYLRRSDGTLLAPVPLEAGSRVTVDRRLTGCTGGQWMLAAVNDAGYAAYTRPGSYDTYAILPTDGGTEELPPSLYEQFVARVLESASSASTSAQKAAASAAATAANAAQAQTAAQRTGTDSASAAQSAVRAEAAAARAEELAPEEGRVVSVNGKAGIVKLTAQDVSALPCPAQPVGACTLGHNADRHPRLVGQPPQQIGANSTGPQNRNRTNFHTYPLPCFYGLMMQISVLSSCSVQCHGFRMIP